MFDGTQDQRLTMLAESLPEYCLKSKAENTRKVYRYALIHFLSGVRLSIPVFSIFLPMTSTLLYIRLISQSNSNQQQKFKKRFMLSLGLIIWLDYPIHAILR
jgi:hypothetical protein